MSRSKFSVQQEFQDFTSKIVEVVNRTICKKHGAREQGEPCWWLDTVHGKKLAVCDKRARQIYNGNPSERNRQTARAAVRKAGYEVRA